MLLFDRGPTEQSLVDAVEDTYNREDKTIMKVMIVDENSMARGLLRQGLQAMGITDVMEAHHGREALETLPDSGVELVFLDWHMPEMDGLTALKIMRKMEGFKRLPVVMVTAEGHMESLKQGVQAGIDQYLIKPFDEAALRRTVNHVTQHHPWLQPYHQARQPLDSHHRVIRAFVDATIQTMGGAASLPLQPNDPILGCQLLHADLTARVTLSGLISGAVMLGFPDSLATAVVRAFLVESAQTPEGVRDGIEEILNMIVGKARASLASTPYQFEMTVPTMICTPKHELPLTQEDGQVWVVPFDLHHEEFVLGLCLNERHTTT